MASEPFAVPELLAALTDAADHDAVYAALMASASGRRFLAEFAARNRHADTTMVVAAIARVEAAIRGEAAVPAPPPAAARAGELIEIAAAIDRIRIAMSGAATPPSQLAAAIERIQDLAFVLNDRAVDADLCDALDAAVAELAAAAGSASDRSAVAMHALASRVAEMIGERGGAPPVASAEELPASTELFAVAATDGEALAQAAASLAAAAAPPLEAAPLASAPPEIAATPSQPVDESAEPPAAEFANGQGAEAHAIETVAADSEPSETAPAAAMEPAAVAEPIAPEASDSAAILSRVFADDFFVAKEASAAAAPTPEGEGDRVDQAVEQALPAPPPNEAAAPAQDVGADPTAGPQEDPADLFEPQAENPTPSAADEAAAAEDAPEGTPPSMESAPPAEPAQPPRVVPPPPPRAIPRPPLSDPLAAVRDLSDEERIALFS